MKVPKKICGMRTYAHTVISKNKISDLIGFCYIILQDIIVGITQ